MSRLHHHQSSKHKIINNNWLFVQDKERLSRKLGDVPAPFHTPRGFLVSSPDFLIKTVSRSAHQLKIPFAELTVRLF
jgi:hypothetical protein